jgi:hypothetical protein
MLDGENSGKEWKLWTDRTQEVDGGLIKGNDYSHIKFQSIHFSVKEVKHTDNGTQPCTV